MKKSLQAGLKEMLVIFEELEKFKGHLQQSRNELFLGALCGTRYHSPCFVCSSVNALSPISEHLSRVGAAIQHSVNPLSRLEADMLPTNQKIDGFADFW